jgi:hypothetical protein
MLAYVVVLHKGRIVVERNGFKPMSILVSSYQGLLDFIAPFGFDFVQSNLECSAVQADQDGRAHASFLSLSLPSRSPKRTLLSTIFGL